MNLQNMAPNAKRSLLLTLVFGAIAALLYFCAIESTESQLARTKVSLQGLQLKHRTITGNLARAEQIKQELVRGTDRLAAYEGEMIEPLLESTAMRAKALADPLATGCGLVGAEYEALDPIVLPVIGRAAATQFVRCPVKITCRGSYQAAVSFVCCVEKRFPLVVLESLSVSASANPDLQQVSITLEWPMKKGASTGK